MDNPWWTRAQGEGADAYLDRVVPVLVAQIADLKEKLEESETSREGEQT